MKRTRVYGRIAAAATIALLLTIGGIVGGSIAVLVAVAPDVVPELRANNLNESRLYEDGSYVLSVGKYAIVGCAPLHPWNSELVIGWCLDGGTFPLGSIKRGVWVWAIGVDSPWEDFAPEPTASFLYWFMETFIKSRY